LVNGRSGGFGDRGFLSGSWKKTLELDWGDRYSNGASIQFLQTPIRADPAASERSVYTLTPP
jgi:hypothetical protein